MVRSSYKFVGTLPNLPRLPKIKTWIDANNPGDPLIPFSVSLEERLSALSEEEKAAAQKEGAQSALGKITQAGYASLDVRARPLPRELYSPLPY
jgi:ribosome-binding ATPase YchF (GTP1/OBG family)